MTRGIAFRCLALYIAIVHAWQVVAEAPPVGKFEALGEPVHIGRLHATCVGPNNRGQRQWVYFAFAQGTAGPPFLLVVDPDTGTVGQFHPPKGCEVNGFKSLYAGKDGSIYIGGYQPARLLRFDPRQPEAGLRDLGVLPGASMVWWFAEAADGRLYMTTSSSPDGSKLFSWDPKTAKIENHGRLSDENEYATHLRVSSDGSTLYAVVAPQKYDVVAFNVKSGKRRRLLADAQRGRGDFPGIFRGEDIRRQAAKVEDGPLNDEWLYAELPNKRFVLVDRVAIDPGQSESALQDGRRVITANAEELLIADKDGKERKIPLHYQAGTEVFTLHSDPQGKLYGATHAPLQLFSYDSESGKLTVLGNPFATADGSLKAAANWQGKLILAGYPGCDLAVYDPSRPWNKGPTPEYNPWTWGMPEGEGHTRPSGIVVGNDGMVYVASDSSYGVPGGAVACIDPRTGHTVSNLREPFVSRSIASLAADPKEPLLYIGCIGVEATADGAHKGAHVMAWDTSARRVRWDVVPVENAQSVTSLHFIGGRLCGTTMHDYTQQHFFALEPGSGKTILQKQTPVAAVVHGNVRPGPDGWLYGLSYVERTLFRIHPELGTVQSIARPPRTHAYALAVRPEGLYFGNGATLTRFRFGKPLPK